MAYPPLFREAGSRKAPPQSAGGGPLLKPASGPFPQSRLWKQMHAMCDRYHRILGQFLPTAGLTKIVRPRKRKFKEHSSRLQVTAATYAVHAKGIKTGAVLSQFFERTDPDLHPRYSEPDTETSANFCHKQWKTGPGICVGPNSGQGAWFAQLIEPALSLFFRTFGRRI